MPSYTPNYNLYLPSRLDETIEVDTSLSDNFTKIDTEIKNRENEIGDLTTLTTTAKNNLVSAINEHDGEIGNLSSLTTTNKTNLVSAINEHDSELGDLSSLTTTNKLTVVAAINEVKGNTDTNSEDIGEMSNLTTTNKNSLVDAVNEVKGEVKTNTTNIGTLSNLTTTDKTSLVAAINELDANKLEGQLTDSDIATNAGIQASKLAIQKMYKKSDEANPGATADTFGTQVDLTPATGYSAIVPLGIDVVFGGTFGAETVTADITVTFSDATTATITKTATTTETQSLTNTDLMVLAKDGVYITQISVKSKSSISSSTATVTFNHYGFYL